MVEVTLPLAAIATLVGLGVQVAGKAGEPAVGTMLQVTAIVPAKPPTEVKVATSVLPVVAPDVKFRDDDPALTVKPPTLRLMPAEVELL